MPRPPALALGLALSTALACTDAGNQTPPATPSSEPASPVTHPRSETETEPTNLEALALRCDGPALAAQFAKLDPTALTDPSHPPSTRLLAQWETTRSFTPSGTLDPTTIDALLETLTTELTTPPPTWWSEQLASATLSDNAALPFYDPALTPDGDRRGPLLPGPATTQIRPAMQSVVSGANGRLFFDLSMHRLELGPLPASPNATLEFARAHAGTTIYYASFNRSSGGVRFPLHAIASDGRQLWQAEVCGPDRKILGGEGHLTVEIVVLEPSPAPQAEQAPRTMKRPSSGPPTGIAVFSAETHGVAVEVFDPQTGARTLAWSSDLWSSR